MYSLISRKVVSFFCRRYLVTYFCCVNAKKKNFFCFPQKFIGKENVALILGDNFFYGQSLTKRLQQCVKLKTGASVFLHPVKNPSLYGIASINKKKKILKIVEKPKKYFSCSGQKIRFSRI